MVAPAGARPRSLGAMPKAASRPRKDRPVGMYVLIAVPLLLVATLLWQVGSNVFHTEELTHPAVGVSQVTLEADPSGTRVDLVMVDRFGQETTFDGNLSLTVREPDGAMWQTSRRLSSGDFQPLANESLMAGRTGYTLVVNARDWARPPRRGGLATISVNATPSDGSAAFTSQSQQRFP